MSYSYISAWDSPNYTPASRVQATFGRPRTIEAIAIHWWGDPNNNPSFEGIVNFLCSPSAGVSAHFVATGTGRRAACLVNLADASWATNSANPYTISIECDPRARNEDYDVVAEVIAQLRQVYGDLPLVPHNKFASTACPGAYDLGRLDREARNKIAKPEWDWGHVENKQTEQPKPSVTEDRSKRVTFPNTKKYRFNKDSYLYNILDYTKSSNTVYPSGTEVDIKQSLTLTNGNHWYRTEYSATKEIGKGFRAEDLAEVVPPTPKPEPKPEPKPTPAPEKPTPKPDLPSEDKEMTTLLQDVKRLLEWLKSWVEKTFKT